MIDKIIWGVNWFGLIISFILGFLFKKNEDKIVNFIKGLIFYFKYVRKQQYNDFFECNFKESDFEKEVDKHDE